MHFKEGDLVVVPGCGVGHIEEIETMDLGDDVTQMYRILVEATEMRLWIPVHRAAVDGLRAPFAQDDIERLLTIIQDTEAPEKRATWNRRQRRYQELLMSNDPIQLAELLGELASVRQRKALSFGERKMFDRAWDLMQVELRSACDAPDEVVQRFESALAA